VYLGAGTFWFKTVATWQTEFVGTGLFIVFGIFLRHEGSAESRPRRKRERADGRSQADGSSQ